MVQRTDCLQVWGKSMRMVMIRRTRICFYEATGEGKWNAFCGRSSDGGSNAEFSKNS